MYQIVGQFLKDLRTMLSIRNVVIEVSPTAEDWLVQHGYDMVYGARPLTRLIGQKIKQPLSRMLLFGPLRRGGTAQVTVADDDLVVRC